jgi:hypothetical protein
VACLPRSRLWCTLRHQVGRRGYFLLTLAVIDAYYGWVFVSPETPSMAMQNRFLADVIPFATPAVALWVWAIGWWTTGAVCLVTAFRVDDRFGYGAAFSLKIAWIAANALAGFEGMPGAWTRVIVWSFVASSVLVIAKWPEPRHSLPEIIEEIQNSGEMPRVFDDGEGRS